MGTPQQIVSFSGQILWSANYSAFGQASVSTNVITNNLRLAGQYYDQETNLHYNYFRYYDPTVGRYLTSDPLGVTGLMEALGDSFSGQRLGFTGQDTNLYAYVRNNPLLYIDPEGALIQFGPAIAKALRIAVLVFRLYTSTDKAPKQPKITPPELPVPTKPVIVPSKSPKPPNCS